MIKIKKDKVAIIYSIVIVSLFFICGALIIGSDYLKNEHIYFIFKNLIIIIYTAICTLSIIALKKYLNIISIVLIIVHCILLFGQLYFLPNRLYYKLLILIFILSFIYTVIILILKLVRKVEINNTLDVPLLNAVLPTTIIGMSYFMKTFYLFDTIQISTGEVMLNSFLISLVVAMVTLIIYLIFKRDRTDKKEYFGMMAGVIFGTIIITMFLLFGTINNVNYAFDSSEKISNNYEIIDKEIAVHGRGRNSYHIIFNINGEPFDMKVNKVVYFNYEIGDSIQIYEYEGALGYSYYEYQIDSIYIYDE